MANFPNARRAENAKGNAIGPETPEGPVGGGNAPDTDAVRINPEILTKVPPLEGLEDIHTVLVQSSHTWARWTEGVVINVVAAVLLAGVMGFTLGGSSTGVGGENNAQVQKTCDAAPAPK